MRIGQFLPCILGGSLVHEVSSALRLSGHALRQIPDGVRDDDTFEEIGKELEDAGKKIEETGDKTFKNAQRGPASGGNAKKPMMDGIEVMRAMMCWGRKKLIEHEDCMAWMVDNCKEETTGEGYCKKLRKYIRKKCRKGNMKACDYGADLGLKMERQEGEEAEVLNDQDGDGILDKDDAFPDNPMESKDTDGDGVGDNTDKFPEDPMSIESLGDQQEGDEVAAPGPAPMSAIGGDDVAAPGGMSAPSPGPAPTGLTMDASVPLPSQGYNEHSVDYVTHVDQKTMTKDWRAEWPMSEGDEEDSINDICADNPHYAWCKLKRSRRARAAYARSHQ